MAASLLQKIQNSIVVFTVGLPNAVVSLLAGRPEFGDGQPLDPQLQLLLKLIAAAGLPRAETLPAATARAFFRQSAGLLAPPAAEMAHVLNRNVPGLHGDIPVRIFVPKSGKAPHPVLVYYHGGGFTVGDLDTHDGITRALASDAECIVVAVDYRMGPEYRFPCAVDDALAAFAWVAAQAAQFGGDVSRLAVAGDSAGGNLSAVVAQQTHNAGLRSPDFQLLLYPVTDLGGESRSYELFAEGFYLTRELMRWFADNYLGDRNAPEAMDPRASPLRAESLTGLPSTFLVTAGYDPLRDEGKAYAERLLDAGVDVEYRNYDSLIHGFFSMTGVVREAKNAYDDAVAALRLGLGVDN